MAQISIDSKDKRQIDEIIRFVKNFALELPVEARFVLAIEMGRLFKPEIDELRRRNEAN